MNESFEEDDSFLSLSSKPSERKRKFSQDQGVSESIPFSVHFWLFLKSVRFLLLPKVNERPHSGSYLVWSKNKVRDYEASVKKPIESIKNRANAKYSSETPVVIGGHRVHRLLVPIFVVVLLIVVWFVRTVLFGS